VGALKDATVEGRQRRTAARAVALRAGVLERCPACGQTYDPMNGEDEAAYRLAARLVAVRDPLVAPFGGDRRRLQDSIAEVIEDHGPECRCPDRG
jgi:hypothetical protein